MEKVAYFNNETIKLKENISPYDREYFLCIKYSDKDTKEKLSWFACIKIKVVWNEKSFEPSFVCRKGEINTLIENVVKLLNNNLQIKNIHG